MANITLQQTGSYFQRDHVLTLKKEIILNVKLLNKVYPPSSDLARLLKENSLEKPSQNVFNHLSHYLVGIIDPQVVLPWPLYDTKSERTYRNELSCFITEYSSRGLLSPVMSSYLVNPGAFKVILLLFQMSQLAVKRVLTTEFKNKEHIQRLYSEVTEKYKSQKDGFIQSVDKETLIVRSKYANHMRVREAFEQIAKKLRDFISKTEEKLKKNDPQGFIDSLVNGYVKTRRLDNKVKEEILKIKNVHVQPEFFVKWLAEVDQQLSEMEEKWDQKMTPFLKITQTTAQNTEMLIARQTGAADKKSYSIEFNPKTDDISTDELQKEVNSQQKYVLKNIIKDGELNFPNLIKGFVISICFILKNEEIGDEIYRFNKYLGGGQQSYNEIVSAMRMVIERITTVEDRIPLHRRSFNSFASAQDMSDIPAKKPDLSDLKMNVEYHPQITFDPFTPLNINKHQFNLMKQRNECMIKLLPKSLLITPFHAPKEDFLRPIITCNSYNNMNVTNNNINLSVISHITKGNETIAECTSGFTKQQIFRLLSTKKSSSTKKFKHKLVRPNIKIKKGGLFPETNSSNESIAMLRSHSSPNLYDNIEKRSRENLRTRRLSIMKEDSPSLLGVSGITAIERDSSHSTPHELMSLESTRKLIDASSLPSISVNNTPRSDADVSNDIEGELNKEININDFEEFKQPQGLPLRKSREIQQIVQPQRKSIEIEKLVQPQRKSIEITEDTKSDTPKTNPKLIQKTNSLEKIINRFKKVRASVLPTEPTENNDFKTIFEEKENLNMVNVDVFTANRNLLPDLLSPSCSKSSPVPNEFLEQLYYDSDEERPRKPRESLGTALGVDQTILDQFDLID